MIREKSLVLISGLMFLIGLSSIVSIGIAFYRGNIAFVSKRDFAPLILETERGVSNIKCQLTNYWSFDGKTEIVIGHAGRGIQNFTGGTIIHTNLDLKGNPEKISLSLWGNTSTLGLIYSSQPNWVTQRCYEWR